MIKTFSLQSKNALDLINAAAKLIAIIIGLVLVWTAIDATVKAQGVRIVRVEQDHAQFKAEVTEQLRSLTEHVHQIAVGVATLVERTKDMKTKENR